MPPKSAPAGPPDYTKIGQRPEREGGPLHDFIHAQDGEGRKRKRKATSALRAIIRMSRKRGMTINDLIKFLVVRPDRKRKKKKPSEAKVVQPKSMNGPAPPDYTKVGQNPERTGALDNFLGIVPVTAKIAAAAPIGSALVVRKDKDAPDGLAIIPYDGEYQHEAGDKFFLQRDGKLHDVTKEFKQTIKHVDKTLADSKKEKESLAKDRDIAKEKADKLEAEKKSKEEKTKAASIHLAAIAIMKRRYTINDLRRIAKRNTGDYDGNVDSIIKGHAPHDRAEEASKVIAAWKDAMQQASAGQHGSGKGKIAPLMTSDIDQKMKDVPGFVAAIARDQTMEAPKSPPRTGVSWVMNMDTSSEPGSHWVGIVIQPTAVCYCDSFGEEPPDDIREKLVEAGTKIWPEHQHKTFKVNRVPHQDARTATCGYHAMKFIADMCLDGKSFPAATGYETLKGQVHKDEKAIRIFAAKFPKFHQVGEGLFTLSNTAPPTVKRAMDKIGDWKIVALSIVRQPIQSFIRAILNGLTLGKLDQVLKEKGYDKLFHLSLFVRCEPPDAKDGSTEEVWKFDKGPLVSVKKERPPLGKDIESKPAAPGRHLVKDLFKRQNEPGFYTYSAFTNNCQDWILKMLQSIGAANPQVTAFVKQDAASIGKALGWFAPSVAQEVTDLGGRVAGAVDQVRDLTGLGRIKWQYDPAQGKNVLVGGTPAQREAVLSDPTNIRDVNIPLHVFDMEKKKKKKLGGVVSTVLRSVGWHSAADSAEQRGWNLRMVPAFVHDPTGMTHPYHPVIGMGMDMHTKPMYATVQPKKTLLA